MSLPESLKFTPPMWKAGVQVAVAGVVAFLIAHYTKLPQGYWAVITAVMIVQASIGASINAAADRIVSTSVGTIIGYLVAVSVPSTFVGTVAGLFIALVPLAMMAAKNPSYRIAPLTAAILFIAAPSHASVFLSGLHRVIEITIGSVIGVAVAFLVFPSRAETTLRKEAGKAIALLAELFTLEVEGLDHPDDKAGKDQIAATKAQLGKHYRTIDTLTKAVEKEQQSRLSEGQIDPRRLGRDLQRLNAAVTFLPSVKHLERPEDGTETLAAPLQTVSAATRDYLDALASAVIDGTEPPPLDNLRKVYAQFSEEAAAARQAATQDKSFQERRQVEGFIAAFKFALDQVPNSLEDLVDSFTEDTGGNA